MLNSLMVSFVSNIETLQPVLVKMSSLNPYLLTISNPNYLKDLTTIDEKLHNLCIESLDAIVREKNYNEFQLIVKRLNDMVVSQKSLLAKIIDGFPTDLLDGIKSILELLSKDIENKGIRLKISGNQPNMKLLFHKTLFYDVFKEFMLNMCKHCEGNGNAELIINTNEQVIEITLIHLGELKHARSCGTGENMIEEILRVHNGKFIYPKKNETNMIESKLILQRWL
ncbi:MAG: hypothetical protein FJ264_16505 [Planctomycetes bacterium]|nr:hypothetical protein [Planctomycetota bacterium]